MKEKRPQNATAKKPNKHEICTKEGEKTKTKKGQNRYEKKGRKGKREEERG